MRRHKTVKYGTYFEFKYAELDEALGMLVTLVAEVASRVKGRPENGWVKIDRNEINPEKAWLQWSIDYKTKKEAGA